MDSNINVITKEIGYNLPDFCVWPKDFGLPNDSIWERNYDILVSKLRDVEDKLAGGIGFMSGTGGSSVDGHDRDWEEGGKDAPKSEGNAKGYSVPGNFRRVGHAEGEQLRQEVAQRMMEHNAKKQGSVPNQLLVWAGDILSPPQIPWHKQLRYVMRTILSYRPQESSYDIRSKRQQMYGRILVPGKLAHEPDIGVNMDTSGSMCDGHSHTESVSEIAGMLKAYRRVRLISCDADVHSADLITNAKRIKLVGGGGTSMGRGLEYFAKAKPVPTVVITFTDGYTDWPEFKFPFHHVTVMTTKDGQRPPFGTVIYLN
jgi:predicted metal-dependent peptidase